MCKCICICKYVYMYMCIYVYMYMCIYVHMYVCIYIYIYMYMCIYVYLYVCKYAYLSIYTYNPQISRFLGVIPISHEISSCSPSASAPLPVVRQRRSTGTPATAPCTEANQCLGHGDMLEILTMDKDKMCEYYIYIVCIDNIGKPPFHHRERWYHI